MKNKIKWIKAFKNSSYNLKTFLKFFVVVSKKVKKSKSN